MKKTFLLFGVVFFTVNTDIQGQREKSSNNLFDLSFSYRESPKITLSNFPTRVRNVPLHPNDGYLQYNHHATEILPDATLVMHKPSGIDMTLTINRAPFVLGLVYSIHFSEGSLVNSDQRYQQNQFGNASREEGTSLRWYQPITGISQLGIGGALTTRWIRISEQAGFRLQGGGVYDLTGLKVFVQEGYDRWGKDETWEKSTIGLLKEHRVFASVEIGIWGDEEEGENKRAYIKLMYLRPFYQYNLKGQSESPMVFHLSSILPFSAGIGITF